VADIGFKRCNKWGLQMKRPALLSTSALCPALFLATTAVSAPAFAQAAQPVENTTTQTQETTVATKAKGTTNAAGQPTSEQEIVITGSRIPQTTYNTPAPVDVVNRTDAVLTGARSTSQILQSPTITSGSAQVNEAFLGFVSEGGPAANTVGLRGLGSSRTLVLLNGRRLAPAGAGPQLVSADLNVLPTTAVQRIEVLREGASSIYGSDAIAGVINILTDTKVNGVTFDAFTDQPVEHGGGGRTYRLSAVAGKTFDHGHITASFEYRQLTGMRLNDRRDDPNFVCPTDLLTDANGNPVGQLDPTTGKIRCFPFQIGPVGTAQDYMLGINYTTGAINRFTYVNNNINQLQIVNNFNLRPPASFRERYPHVISPIKTYTAYLNGAYDVFGNSEVYVEGLFSRRKSHQDFVNQISIDPNQLGSEIYGGTLYGYPISYFGVVSSPFFPNSVAALGVNALRVFIVPPLLTADQKVDFYRADGGLRGGLGIGDLRYDANIMYSRTKARYGLQNIDTRRFQQSLNPVLAPASTPAEFTTTAIAGEAGAGNGYTCASNVSGGSYNGGKCVPADLFNPSTLAGNLPDNLFSWLFTDNVGHTTFEQWTAEANVVGHILHLPAGDVGFALGAVYRSDYINDVPSEAAITQNLYNYSSSGITRGKDRVFEGYGELNIPLIKDKPFAYDLSFTASGRYTHYRSYGSGFTYRLNGTYSPIKAVRFRGSYGTSFRAPNLFEQFVADQSGFYRPGTDPCNEFASRSAPGQPLYNNCLAALAPILGTTGALNYIDVNGAQVFTRGGAGNLKAEKSKAWGLGVILEAPFADASLAVDFFNIRVRDEVNLLNTTILDRCFEATDYPNNIYCGFIAPRDPVQGTLTSFQNPYLNIASQLARGIDISGRFAHDVGAAKFVANARVTRMLKQTFQQFSEEAPFDYNGLLGYQGTVGGPKWTGDLDLRLEWSDFIIRWGIKYVGKMDDTGQFDPVILNGVPVNYDLKADPYIEHGASIQWKWEKVGQVTLGVKNLFNRKPAVIGSHSLGAAQFPRIGNYFNYSGYDFIGRSVFLNVTRSF
jgi:iron complex outermembrane recepter protein